MKITYPLFMPPWLLWPLRIWILVLVASCIFLGTTAAIEERWISAGIQFTLVGANLCVVWVWWILFAPTRDPYRDRSYPIRRCDLCGQFYRGPALYCSLRCAENDANDRR